VPQRPRALHRRASHVFPPLPTPPTPHTPYPPPPPPPSLCRLVQLLATAFVMSWSGVVRIHGIRPTPRAGERAGVFVANHSSMNDFILLLQSHPYAVVGQKHVGWVGFLQKTVLTCLNCVWFDRGAEDDKKKAADILQRHIQDINKNSTPALIFPEGTCVNNEYVVQVSCAGSRACAKRLGSQGQATAQCQSYIAPLPTIFLAHLTHTITLFFFFLIPARAPVQEVCF
jgi:1-acyl-sn-glycerol-3-phosphate acyltransferase